MSETTEIKKLTTEELESIKSIKNEYTKLALALGELELQTANIAKEKQRLLDIQSEMVEKEIELSKTLTDKYGSGTIDIETGEIK